MNLNIFSNLILLFIFGCFSAESDAQKPIPAFPGAEGGGANATGGRGGRVVYVTSLEDSDSIPGTLRWALEQKSPKTILFKVAGIINLKSDLRISKPNVTIAGQSAPGDGICIKGYPVYVSADNVIVRFMRFRMGDENHVQDDALKGNKRKNVIIDHCSMSWSTDECASFYDNENFTLQWCIIAESLSNSIHKKGSHGFGGIWGGKSVSYHHNLLAHHNSRNPRFCGSRYSNQPYLEKVDFRNNVIYNWGYNSAYAGEGGEYNIVNNYYKPGPATLSKKGKFQYRIFSPNADDGTNNQPAGVWGKFYLKGNFVDGHPEVSSDNMKGFHPDLKDGEVKPIGEIISNREFKMFIFKKQTAVKAYQSVLKHAGASFSRDTIDRRIVHEVLTGTYTFSGSNGSTHGIIDTQQDVGGWPVYKFNDSEVPVDSDGDGMPDGWELKNKLNPHDSGDGILISGKSGYSNLEIYLNNLVNKLY